MTRQWSCAAKTNYVINRETNACSAFIPPIGFIHESPEKNWGSQLTHCELTSKLTVNSFWEHLSSSQATHKMNSHCELAMSFPWVCNSHTELTATAACGAHWVISWMAHSKLTVWVANSQKAHSVSHLVNSLWGNWVSSKWAFCVFQCELTVS